PNHWLAMTSSTPGTWRMRSRCASGIVLPSPVRSRVTNLFADEGVDGGLSSSSSTVFSVEIRNRDIPMLRIVSSVRRLLRKAFRNMKGTNFIRESLTLRWRVGNLKRRYGDVDRIQRILPE